MAKGCKNLIARAKILVDRLGFGRRFYDDDIHIVLLWNWSVNVAPVAAWCRNWPSL
ncbi:hypothetical protein SZ54_0684 [Rhizobium sp. UR51a]|nr:hypothetical protein SZ54_0684 [Rhizobium sp. UR51a]